MQSAPDNQEGNGDEPHADSSKQTAQQAEFAEVAKSVEMDVFGYLLARVKNHDDAWELTQQTLLNAWKAWPRFKKTEKVHGWFIAIAENLWIDRHRKATAQKRGQPLSLDAMSGDDGLPGASTAKFEPADDGSAASPHEDLERQEELEILDQALSLLGADDQQLLELYRHQLSYEEIAAATGRSVAAIGPALTRARDKLSKVLKTDSSL